MIAEQESAGGADFVGIAASWEATLRSFIDSGGIIIATNAADIGWRLVDRPTLVAIGSTANLVSGTELEVVPGAGSHPLVAGLSSPYMAPMASALYSPSSGGAVSLTPIIRTRGVLGGATAVWDAQF